MAAPRKAAAKPLNESAQAADESGVYLDPKLAEVRDAEMKALADIKVEPRPEPTIDPELVKLREAEVKRGDRQIV